MTAVEAAPAPIPVGWDDPAPRHASASWRMAARLARREVRRRLGRTILVALLVAVPSFAMVTGFTLYRAQGEGADDRYALAHGAGVDIDLQRNVGDLPDERLAELLPDGSRWSRQRMAAGTLAVGPASTYVELTDRDLTDPIAGSTFDLRTGSAPGPGQVVIGERLADDLDLGVGDDLVLDGAAHEISGVGRLREAYDSPTVIAGVDSVDWSRVRNVDEQIDIDVPGDLDVAETEALIATLGAQGGWGRALNGQHDTESVWAGIAWGWVAGTLALAAVGIIVAAAFAIGSRRQLVTVGLLSAQGASPAQVRRTLALQGAWNGLLGAAVGSAAAVAAVLAARPFVLDAIGRDIAGLGVHVVDVALVVATGVVVATIAAFVPARAVSRVPTLTALSGRRPVGRVPRRMLPAGLVLFIGGTVVLAVVAAASTSGRSSALNAVGVIVGGLAVMFGACCLSPVVVDAVTRLGGRLRGTARLAARSMRRARARSAGTVTAIAVAGGAALAVCAAIVTATAVDPGDEVVATPDEFWHVPEAPADAVLYTSLSDGLLTSDLRPLEDLSVPAVDRGLLEAMLPDAEWAPLRMATLPTGEGVDADDPLTYLAFTIADPAILDVIDPVDVDRERLDEVGALVLDRHVLAEVGQPASADVVDVPLPGSSATTLRAAVRHDLPETNGFGLGRLLVTEDAARAAGLVIVEQGVVLRTPRALTADQRDQLARLGNQGSTLFVVEGEDPEATVENDPDLWWAARWAYVQGPEIDPRIIQAAIIGAALIATLFVVAISLGLSAAEGRDERDVLIAVGAPPRTLRRMAGGRAAVLVVAGVLLAVPTGLLPALVVIGVVSDDRPRVPVAATTLLLVAVPVLVGLGAWAASSIAQRIRPPVAAHLATD